jgi:RNA polymerase sigma factor (sigma-70 family)
MRQYKDVKKLMFSIANRIKLRTEDAGDLVNDAWVGGRLHNCPDKGLSRAITQDMLDARRVRDGEKGGPKLAMNMGLQNLENLDGHNNGKFSFEDKGLLELENKELVNKLLKSLDETGQMVFSGHISKGRTFSELGKDLGISKQAAKRIFDKAMAKLKDSKLIKDLGQVR